MADSHAKGRGPWKLVLTPYQKDDPEHVLALPPDHPQILAANTIKNPGYSLRQLRQRFGGDEGHFTDPDGVKHAFSLKPWAGHDADQTRFRIHYTGARRHDPAVAEEARRIAGMS